MSVGIPCIYYGTEQGFDGSGGEECYVREAMFGGEFGAFRSRGKHFFNEQTGIYTQLAKIIDLRKEHLTLQQGRQYLRQISYAGDEFSYPTKVGSGRYTGLIAWSRILSASEIVLAVNCDLEKDRQAEVIVEKDLYDPEDELVCIYSSRQEQINSREEVVSKGEKAVVNICVPVAGAVAYKLANGGRDNV
jgi:hypothetical protein